MRIFRTLTAAIRSGTRIGGPVPPQPDLMCGALQWQPIVGLGIGLFGAIPTLFICNYCSSLQGFLLFSSVIYLVLTEWITRFHGLHELARVTGALKKYGLSYEERLALLESGDDGIPDAVCTMICIAAKTLLLYLFILRLGLFGSLFPLAVILVLVPALSRAIMLLAYPATDPRPEQAAFAYPALWQKVLHVLFWYLLMSLCFALIYLFGVHVFSVVSMRMNLENLGIIAEAFQSKVVFFRFVRYWEIGALILFPGIFLPVYYWLTEAKKKCGHLTPSMGEPLRETAEVVLYTMCLIWVDVICF